jgi:hypothetical protein
MNTAGKHKLRRLSAVEHRERAQKFRMQAIRHLDRKARTELMLSAIKHEAIAEELDRLDSSENRAG